MKMKLVISLLAAMFAAQAQATLSVYVSGQGLAASQAAEASFLASLNSYITEDFEGFTAGTQSPSIVTSVGTFSMVIPGIGGACNNLGYTCAELGILDNGATAADPFSGRIGITGITGKNYLDSFDARVLTFTPSFAGNAIGFYITDPNDVGGNLGIEIDNIFGGALPNGQIFYVSVFSDTNFGAFAINKNAFRDGFGLDNMTVGTVPEPGSLALLGLGCVALSLARRRQA